MADSKDPGPPLPASRSKGEETSSSDSATGNKITISIRTLDGKTTKIEADRSWSVQQLKAAFGEYRGQDFSRVNMHYKGKRLKDDLKIEAYNIDSDGFVQANIRSEGGTCGSGANFDFN